MGRRSRYSGGPTQEQIAAMRKAQDDALLRQGVIQIIIIIVISLLLTAGLWYFAANRLEWWQLFCLPPLIVIAVISGLFRLIRWLRIIGL